jgi:hypothetical protein
MRGRQFLDLASEIVGNGAERHWRGAHVHAYYALFLEARDALERWGFGAPSLQSVHHHVRNKLTFAGDKDLKNIGITLDYLSSAAHGLPTSWVLTLGMDVRRPPVSRFKRRPTVSACSTPSKPTPAAGQLPSRRFGHDAGDR